MKRIFIIEDDRNFYNWLMKLLKPNYEMAGAMAAREGLERLREERPDLVMLDMKFPKEPGPSVLPEKRMWVEVLKEIKGYDNSIKVILLGSQDEDEGLVKEMMQKGALDDCVMKYDLVESPNRLLETIKRVLEEEEL